MYCAVVNVNDISMHSIPLNYKQPQYGGPLQVSIVLPFILPCIACPLSTIAVGFVSYFFSTKWQISIWVISMLKMSLLVCLWKSGLYLIQY